MTTGGFKGTPRINGGVEVVGLGASHRLSLAQNPVLLAGQIAILLASCNRDVARLRKRRQVAGRPPAASGCRTPPCHYPSPGAVLLSAASHHRPKAPSSHNPTTKTPPLGLLTLEAHFYGAAGVRPLLRCGRGSPLARDPVPRTKFSYRILVRNIKLQTSGRRRWCA